MKPLLIRHLSGENFGRFPVWMMRQAGRYLPEYQEIRRNNTFWEMVTRPDVACKVSLLPIHRLDVDAVIFFSDILTLPYGLGIDIELKEGIGPVVLNPLTRAEEFKQFLDFDADKHTGFVKEAQKQVISQLDKEKALIGFAGAPWTVAAYLIEGRGNRHFDKLKNWLWRDPASLAAAMSDLGVATARYLRGQAESGAHALQLFDTWASEMPVEFFRTLYLPVLNKIFDELSDCRVPLIYFAKGSAHLMQTYGDLRADVLGVDSLDSMTSVEQKTGARFSLQGNLDPYVLLTDESNVRKATRQLVAEARKLKKPPILNLGHGIFKTTPVANALAFVEEAKQLWI